MLTYNPPPHMDAAALIRRADALMNRWAEKYGLHDPKWLPPAGVVQWQEDAARYLAAHTLPAPTHGVTVPAAPLPLAGLSPWLRSVASTMVEGEDRQAILRWSQEVDTVRGVPDGVIVPAEGQQS